MPVIPNENVDVAYIGQVLTDNGGSVNINEPLTYFTPDAKNNMFSKKKPVVLKINFCQDFDSTKPDYYPEWWKGTSGNCGISFLNVPNLNDLPNVIDGALNGWEYQLPQGGENAPLRLGDFCGYDPNAKPLVEGFSLSASIVENKTGSNFVVDFITTPDESKPTSLTFADLSANLANYYPAIYITNGTASYFISSSTTLGSGSRMYVTVPTVGLATGKWSVYAFISEKQIPTLSTLGSVALGYCYTMPYTNKLEIQIVSSLITIVCNITRPQGSNVLNATIYVTYPSAKTFTNNNLYIKMPTNTNTGAGIQDTAREQIASIPNFSVVANTRTLVYNGTINLNSSLSAQTSALRYVLSLDGGSITQAGTVIHTSPMPT